MLLAPDHTFSGIWEGDDHDIDESFLEVSSTPTITTRHKKYVDFIVFFAKIE